MSQGIVEAINMVGDACLTGVQEDDIPPLYPDSEPIEDPLKDLPPPIWDPTNDLGGITSGGTFGPGYYS